MSKSIIAKKVAVRIRKYKWASDGKRKIYLMSADNVILTIREHIRKTMGDEMENGARVFAERGFFYIGLPYRRPLNAVADNYWRQALRNGIRLRRVSVGLAIRAMHGEILT